MPSEIELGLVVAPRLFLYDEPGSPSAVRGVGPQTDEVFSGWAVRFLETGPEAWVRIQTHYGYEGWVRREALRPLKKEELLDRQDGVRFPLVSDACTDLHAEPHVRGEILATLPRGSIVGRLPDPDRDGWAPPTERRAGPSRRRCKTGWTMIVFFWKQRATVPGSGAMGKQRSKMQTKRISGLRRSAAPCPVWASPTAGAERPPTASTAPAWPL